ncbi:hypothetical protein CPB83DRAFT_858027 [Crepidotus variabilis]|uniref:Uncharacterized protein n=1 Tax=Crepidotus variabilis TaxID=179855 RepID=A0A9P6EC95_9AGAR|nr:hypothetical protein CPB83DRAFT_858027 [Crepidotus variabilis]
MVEGLLAPTKDQWLEYTKWLHVYAKDRANMTRRMRDLWDNYTSIIHQLTTKDTGISDSNINLYDVFEPNLIHSQI